jgi:hypothetical protein
MSDPRKPKQPKGDYEVGYSKPPKHSQFVPGQSGFKGRKRNQKKLESVAAMIARIRDEVHEVGGQSMTSLELAVRQVVNQTIKSGKVRDLKVLLELLDKHGALPEFDQKAQADADADWVLNKIFSQFYRHHEIDPADVAATERDNEADAELVMKCEHCGPELRRRWAIPEYVARAARHGKTTIHGLVLRARDPRKMPIPKY